MEKIEKMSNESELAGLLTGNPTQAKLRDLLGELHESRGILSDLVSQSVDGLAVFQLDGSIVVWNPAMEAITGLPAEQILGEDVADILLPYISTDEGSSNTNFLELLGSFTDPPDWEGVQVRREQLTLKRPDGRIVQIASSTFPIRTREGFRVGTIVRDITAEVLTRQRVLLQSQALEASANAIVITSPTGTIAWCNPAFTTLTGYTIEEALGKNPRQLVWSGRQERSFYQHMWSTIRSGKVWKGSLINRKKDGSLYHEEMTITPVFDRQQQISHFIAVKEDVTLRKQAEERLERLAKRLKLLTEASKEFAIHLDRQQLAERTLDFFLENLDCRFASLYQLEIQNLTFWAARHRAGSQLAGLEIYADSYAQHLLQAVKTGRIVSSLGPAEAEHPASAPLAPGGAFVAAPIQGGASVLGAALLVYEDVSAFDEADLEIIRLTSEVMASSLENIRLMRLAQDSYHKLGLVYDAGLAINSVLDRQTQLEYLLKLAKEALRAGQAVFFLYEPNENQLVFVSEFGSGELFPTNLSGLTIPVSSRGSGTAWAAAHHRSVIYNKRLESDAYLRRAPQAQSMLAAPVERDSKLLGMILVAAPQPEAFDAQDEQMLGLFANQAAVALENSHLYEEGQWNIRRLQAQHKIEQAIAANLSLDAVLNSVLEQLESVLDVRAAQVLLLEPQSLQLYPAAGRSQSGSFENGRPEGPRQTLPHEALIKRVRVSLQDPDGTLFPQSERWQSGAAEPYSYFAVPLIGNEEIKGVLEVYAPTNAASGPGWLQLLDTIALQTASAIQNAQLHQQLSSTGQSAIQAFDRVIQGWSQALDLREGETTGHHTRVTEMAALLGSRLGMSEEQLVHLRRGAQLHDIGRLAIPERILQKEGALDEDEWAQIREAPVHAQRLLGDNSFLQPAMEIPYCHHERWDGSGYPRGLKGEEIPLSARIFSVVDVWEALTSERYYRPAWTPEGARDYIQGKAGILFDPAVVRAFVELIDTQELGREPEKVLGNVLLVGKEASKNHLLAQIFGMDYTIHSAIAEQQAFRILESVKISLILVDGLLDEMDGVTFSKKAQEISPFTPAIILNDLDVEVETQAASHGSSSLKHARKPWNLEDIKQMVIESLQEYLLRSGSEPGKR